MQERVSHCHACAGVVALVGCAVTMPSPVESAKRELVKLLKAVAGHHGLTLELTRDSADNDVEKAFRRVALKAHPDKGGDLAEFQALSAANDVWQEMRKSKKSVGRPVKPDAETRGTPSAGKPNQVLN